MQGKRPLVGYTPLAIWLTGLAVPLVIHLTTAYSHGETGLIQLAALFQVGTIIIAVASATAFLAAAAICLASPPNRRAAAIGGILGAVTLALAAPSALSSIEAYGQPLGCHKVGPDIQIGPDENIQSGEEVSRDFRAHQLRQLHEQVNSLAFRTELAKRLCLDEPMSLTISVRLLQEGDCQSRMVGSAVSPRRDMKCFEETYRYLFQRAVRSLDPAPPQPGAELMTWPEPVCPCTAAPHS